MRNVRPCALGVPFSPVGFSGQTRLRRANALACNLISIKTGLKQALEAAFLQKNRRLSLDAQRAPLRLGRVFVTRLGLRFLLVFFSNLTNLEALKKLITATKDT